MNYQSTVKHSLTLLFSLMLATPISAINLLKKNEGTSSAQKALAIPFTATSKTNSSPTANQSHQYLAVIAFT